jgi:hypothetical protein
VRFESRQELEIFLFSTVSRLVLEPTHSPIQWVTGVLSLGVKRPSREVAIHLHLVPRSEMHGAVPPLQYAFMIWCLVKKTRGTNLPFLLTHDNTFENVAK